MSPQSKIDFATAIGDRFDTFLREVGLARPAVIEQIVDRTYASFPKHGISMVLNDAGLVVAVQFYGERKDSIDRFQGSLPAGLKLEMSRDEARTALGEPADQGDEAQVSFLGNMPAWDKWSIGGTSIHAEYSFDRRSIRLLTIS